MPPGATASLAAWRHRALRFEQASPRSTVIGAPPAALGGRGQRAHPVGLAAGHAPAAPSRGARPAPSPRGHGPAPHRAHRALSPPARKVTAREGGGADDLRPSGQGPGARRPPSASASCFSSARGRVARTPSAPPRPWPRRAGLGGAQAGRGEAPREGPEVILEIRGLGGPRAARLVAPRLHSGASGLTRQKRGPAVGLPSRQTCLVPTERVFWRGEMA